jgi:hypothetical protein
LVFDVARLTDGVKAKPAAILRNRSMKDERERKNRKKGEQSRLRWYQRRLWSLLLLAILVATGMSWLAVTMRSQRSEQAAAEAIQKAGGRALFESTWLGQLLRDDSLVNVKYVGIPAGVAPDPVLARLKGLNHLRGLVIESSKVTDEELVHLEGLSQLEILSLENTSVTDKGLVHLKGTSQLKWLVLNDTEVSDAGLIYLQRLTQLHFLDLKNTRVTPQGVDRLQRALPHCLINTR